MMSVQCRPRGFGMASHGKGPGSGRTLSFLLADICHGHAALFPCCYLGEAFSFLMVPRGGRMAQANVSVHLPLLLGNVRRSPYGQFSGAGGLLAKNLSVSWMMGSSVSERRQGRYVRFLLLVEPGLR